MLLGLSGLAGLVDAGGVTAFLQGFVQSGSDQGVAVGQDGQAAVEVGGGGLAEMFRRPGFDAGGAAQHQRGGEAGAEGEVARGGAGHGGDGAVEPAAADALVHAAFQVVLGLEMAAAAVMAGDGVQNRGVAGFVEGVDGLQRRVQAVEAAEIEQAAIGAGLGQGQFTTQADAVRIAVGLNGGQAIQRAAQQEDDEALVGGGGAEGQRGAAKGEGGGEAQQGCPSCEQRPRQHEGVH